MCVCVCGQQMVGPVGSSVGVDALAATQFCCLDVGLGFFEERLPVLLLFGCDFLCQRVRGLIQEGTHCTTTVGSAKEGRGG